uniref:Uncharacterized protein n=1 Tax=Siphoviridae sp. ctjxN1 TaxID=2825638 RepID=A0A8S5PJ65_9CAUD|nr:MAG TPA: hypothetical protein [Siphoviridae sp. ctjxN1]DAS22838.1 MAG TPA: hypothetical protein [Caudoviricetes sp.]
MVHFFTFSSSARHTQGSFLCLVSKNRLGFQKFPPLVSKNNKDLETYINTM